MATLPESTSFSPQRILERLCRNDADQSVSESAQGPSKIEVKPTNTTKPPLYALVIGISKYLQQTNLKGAVNDATTFKSYLVEDLSVPEEQITTLFDSQATRDAIITAFKNLIADQRINRDDPIVIYYAGHGGEVQPPPSRQINGPLVQCMVPHNASRPTDSSKGIHPIPDFTIGALLGKLADAKGNNITVIFDSCHSASITRTSNVGARYISPKDLCPLPADIDSDVVGSDIVNSDTVNSLQISNRILVAEEEIGIQAMRSHVLLAACGHHQQAYEDQLPPNYPGFFTRALLDVLRSTGADKLTYKGCIQRLPKLLTPKSQNPVCEGTNMDRIFFNAMIPGASSSFILIETKGNQHYLQAGIAQGITPGCTFAIHTDLRFSRDNPSLGTMIATNVKAFQSILRFSEGTEFGIPQPAYARQTGVGSERALEIFITTRFVDAAKPDPRWEQLLSAQEGGVMLRLTDKAQAQVVMNADNNGNATFTLPKLDAAVNHGVERIPYTVPATFDSVEPVLAAIVRWNWHLLRTPPSRPFYRAVEMEFYKLEESGEYDFGQPIYKTQGENLNREGEADISVSEADHYGFHITNRSTRDLYAYMLYFAIPEQAIGGVVPLKFRLGRDQEIDVGIFKLILTTAPIDLDTVKERSPFPQTRTLDVQPRALATVAQVNAILKLEQLWDSLTMTLVQRRDPTLVRPVSGPRTPVENSENALSSLSISQQNTVLRNAGFNHGIHVGMVPCHSSAPVAVLLRSASDCVRTTEITATEDIGTTNAYDARLAHLGFPPLDELLEIPWIRARTGDWHTSAFRTQLWGTRRIQALRVVVSASLEDLEPRVYFVTDVRDALSYPLDWQKFMMMEDVFDKWGDVVPLSMEIGAALVVSGPFAPQSAPQSAPHSVPHSGFGNWIRRKMKSFLTLVGLKRRKSSEPREPQSVEEPQTVEEPQSGGESQSVESQIARCLGVENLFEEPISIRIQNGQLMSLAVAGSREARDFRQWEVVKVTRVAPIVDLLEDDLRSQVYELYARLTFRSSQVGSSQLTDFDYDTVGVHKIEQIIIGFSDSRIEHITIRYANGLVVGPYGPSVDSIHLDKFDLEGRFIHITDMFVWATDQTITSIQFVKNSGEVSPIYGATRGVTQAPVLLTGDGCALAGLSGSFDADGITQIQGIWRRDLSVSGHRPMRTSFAGGHDGVIFNDMQLLGEQYRLTARISQVTARSPGTDFVGGLKVTYINPVGENDVLGETPVHGTDNGQVTTWRLGRGEYITAVRGRHDGTSICELQFTTNRNRESPAFGMAAGDFHFNFDAPKGGDGKVMELQHMVGKSGGRVNSIMFVWAEQVDVPWVLED